MKSFLAKTVGAGLAVALVFMLAAGIYSALGALASWVLSFVGVSVPWYACAVGLFIIGAVFGRASK